MGEGVRSQPVAGCTHSGVSARTEKPVAFFNQLNTMGSGCDDLVAVGSCSNSLRIITPRSYVDMLHNSTVVGLSLQNAAPGGSICPFIDQQGRGTPEKITD